ncbi:unnamed protein product [Linum trigynum]|uniref:Uncharacterized protein n=1 Tax=Linum trigynum TaxID=586398 RepID=A0AAV2DT66_9ROSI
MDNGRWDVMASEWWRPAEEYVNGRRWQFAVEVGERQIGEDGRRAASGGTRHSQVRPSPTGSDESRWEKSPIGRSSQADGRRRDGGLSLLSISAGGCYWTVLLG